MKKTALILSIAIAALTLCACEAHNKKPAPVQKAPPQDFLTLGRDLSNGAVDLYDPSATDFSNVTAPAGRPGAPLSAVPGNPNIIVNDPSVTIYSLDTLPDNAVTSEPLPLGLPDLQPPTSTQSNYPSPFDKSEPAS